MTVVLKVASLRILPADWIEPALGWKPGAFDGSGHCIEGVKPRDLRVSAARCADERGALKQRGWCNSQT